jgi:hypothetical protein
MYRFTKFVPSETNPNNSRSKDTIPMIYNFDMGTDYKSKAFRKCIVVAYRESWCDYPGDSTQYQDYKVGNRLMNRRDPHFHYYVNKVDDSIVVVDFTRYEFEGNTIGYFYGWLEHYWYEELI